MCSKKKKKNERRKQSVEYKEYIFFKCTYLLCFLYTHKNKWVWSKIWRTLSVAELISFHIHKNSLKYVILSPLCKSESYSLSQLGVKCRIVPYVDFPPAPHCWPTLRTQLRPVRPLTLDRSGAEVPCCVFIPPFQSDGGINQWPRWLGIPCPSASELRTLSFGSQIK